MATRVLGVALVICSLMASPVPESLPWLVLTGATLPEFKLPALLTNTFVARPSSILGVLLFLALTFSQRTSYHARERAGPDTLAP